MICLVFAVNEVHCQCDITVVLLVSDQSDQNKGK